MTKLSPGREAFLTWPHRQSEWRAEARVAMDPQGPAITRVASDLWQPVDQVVGDWPKRGEDSGIVDRRHIACFG
jgi:hypothetical protein